MTGAPDKPTWTTCPACGKRAFQNRKSARKAAARDSLQRLSAYECHSRPGAWHIGHLPAGVIRGAYSRSNLSRHARRRSA